MGTWVSSSVSTTALPAGRDRQRTDLEQAVGRVHLHRSCIRRHQGHACPASFVQQHVPFLPQAGRRQAQAQRHRFLAGQVRAFKPHLAAEHALRPPGR